MACRTGGKKRRGSMSALIEEIDPGSERPRLVSAIYSSFWFPILEPRSSKGRPADSGDIKPARFIAFTHEVYSTTTSVYIFDSSAWKRPETFQPSVLWTEQIYRVPYRAFQVPRMNFNGLKRKPCFTCHPNSNFRKYTHISGCYRIDWLGRKLSY